MLLTVWVISTDSPRCEDCHSGYRAVLVSAEPALLEVYSTPCPAPCPCQLQRPEKDQRQSTSSCQSSLAPFPSAPTSTCRIPWRPEHRPNFPRRASSSPS